MTKKEIKDKILDRISFGDGVMRAIDENTTNYDIRLLTIYTHIDEKKPLMQLRYELKDNKFKLWVATDDEENGMTGVPQTDNFEEALDLVTHTIHSELELLKEDSIMWSIDWLGD